jgi:hypothetical protein
MEGDMRGHLLYLFVFIAIACLAGCGPKYKMQVDSISSIETHKRSFILLPGNESAKNEKLQYEEFSKYVLKALKDKGFVHVNRIEDADIAITLAYGIGDPRTEVRTYSVPVWGQTGVSSSYTHGTIHSHGSSGTFSGHTTYTPSYGIVGSRSVVKSRVTHFRFMILSAFDIKKSLESNEPIQAWRTSVTSTGSSNDLRLVFPILVAAAKPYISKDTNHKVEITLRESSEEVKEILGKN